MQISTANVSHAASRKEWVLSMLQAISNFEKKDAASVEYLDILEKVERNRNTLWGKRTKREVFLSVSPEKATEDFLNSNTIYIQRMFLPLTLPAIIGGGSLPIPAGPAWPVSNDQELEDVFQKIVSAS